MQFDKELCKQNALAFYKAAVTISKTSSIPGHITPEIYPPYIVNIMLSCELYLKYLLCSHIDKINIKEHKVDQLYDYLVQYEQEKANRIKEIFYSSDYENEQLFSLENKLKMCSNFFVEFRYIHERTDSIIIPIDSIPRFVRTLQTIIEEECEVQNNG